VNVLELDARLLREQFGRQVRGRADALRAELERVVRQLGVEVLVDDQRRRRRREQRVAVGIGLVGGLAADVAARARAVFDDDGLSPFARQELGHDARHGIGGPAGREWHDDLDRAAGIILRRTCSGQRDHRHQRRRNTDEPT
jgi:hypothetical protein